MVGVQLIVVAVDIDDIAGNVDVIVVIADIGGESVVTTTASFTVPEVSPGVVVVM